jgi:hypothetical protein
MIYNMTRITITMMAARKMAWRLRKQQQTVDASALNSMTNMRQMIFFKWKRWQKNERDQFDDNKLATMKTNDGNFHNTTSSEDYTRLAPILTYIQAASDRGIGF